MNPFYAGLTNPDQRALLDVIHDTDLPLGSRSTKRIYDALQAMRRDVLLRALGGMELTRVPGIGTITSVWQFIDYPQVKVANKFWPVDLREADEDL